MPFFKGATDLNVFKLEFYWLYSSGYSGFIYIIHYTHI